MVLDSTTVLTDLIDFLISASSFKIVAKALSVTVGADAISLFFRVVVRLFVIASGKSSCLAGFVFDIRIPAECLICVGWVSVWGNYHSGHSYVALRDTSPALDVYLAWVDLLNLFPHCYVLPNS